MNVIPMFEDKLYHDGRGPELLRAVWIQNGTVLKGFEYHNPDDDYNEDVKHLLIENPEVVSMAGEEVHGNILTKRESRAGIYKVINSDWLKQYNPRHLGECDHYQIIFYDEIYDIICKRIIVGEGRIII